MISDPNANYVSPPHIKKLLADLIDPATEQFRQSAHDHFSEDFDLEQKKRYWVSRSDATASDAAIKEAKLEPIQKRLDELAAKRTEMRGDDNTTNEKMRSPSVKESAQARGDRLLKAFDAQVKASGEHGALARVHTRELATNPNADRSNIGKQIKKAREALSTSTQANAMFGSLVIKGGKRLT